MTQLSHSSPLNDELTRWLFQDSTDGLVLFEPQSLEVVEVNQAAVNLTARSADELIGNPLDAFFVKSAELNQFIGSCRESRCGSPQELRLERPDKTISVVSLDVRTIEIAGGNRGLLRLRTVTSIRDVNETVQAEQALRRGEERYRSLFLNAPVCIHELDCEGRFISMNAAGLRMIHARSESDILGASCIDLVEKSDKPKVEKLLQDALSGKTVAFEFRVNVNGDVLTFSSNLMPIVDADGRVTKLVGVSDDVTRRLESETKLRESEQRFRTIFEQAAVGVALIDTNTGRFVRTNRKYRKMLGYSLDELSGMTFTEITLEGLEADLANMQRLREGQISEFTMEKSLLCKDGSTMWVNLTVSPTWTANEEPRFHIAIVEDISDRKRIERALRKSEKSLAKAQEIARLGNFHLDLESGTVVGSAEAYRMLGISEQDAGVLQLSDVINDYIYPDDRDAIAESVEAAISNGRPTPQEFRHLSTADEVRHFRAEAEMVRDADGNLTGMFGTLQDITERKEAEISLRESEIKFRVIAESCPAMVAIFTDDKIAYANHMVSSTLGYSADELSTMGFLELVHPEDRELVESRHRRRMRGEDVPSRYECKLIGKSGIECWIDFTASLIDYNGTTAILGIALDITERRNTEERLHQREIELAQVSRLTAMGEMVAGIAHEINQPLSAISNLADACKIELNKVDRPDLESVSQWSELIGQQAIRCGDIIKRLRGYVRQKQLDETSVRVQDVIQESIALLRNEFRHSVIDVECKLADPDLTVFGNPVELQQVMVNLLSNAHAAMEQCDPQLRRLSVSSNVNDRFVRIDVEDNGSGIEPGNLEHLFDAFFTTKPEGMGIGLAISRSIIERHKGRLWAENRRPCGAAFHVELPLT